MKNVEKETSGNFRDVLLSILKARSEFYFVNDYLTIVTFVIN